MRIQHNIMAMNAYRNYNTNTSALSKNLEKLSSGYKINRAGDDAAGLAISEKMRAQITGLNAAQKNVKDGVSLVKTAEGAMQEIQDMLNRMDYLATQSANGTYDNEVDRAALQKEVDQLKTEINRIADSANFNGIKLLDGSLDGSAVESVTSTGSGKLPDVGEILGKDTVLHKDQGTPSANTTFSIDLHNLEITGAKGQEFTIEIGDKKLTGTLQKEFAAGAAGTPLTAADIADALGNGTTTNVSFTVEDADGNQVAYNKDEVNFGESTFKATVNGTRVSFEHDPTTAAIDSPDMEVKITSGGTLAKKIATSTQTTVGKDAVGKTAATMENLTAPTAPTDATTLTNAATAKFQVTIGGKMYEVTGTTVADQAASWATAFNADTANNGGFTAVADATGKITFTGTETTTQADFQAVLGTGTTNFVAGSTGNNATIDIAAAANASTVDQAAGNMYDVAVDGKTYSINTKIGAAAADVAQAWADAYNNDNTNVTASVAADGSITLTANKKGTDATSGLTAADAGVNTTAWTTEGTDEPATQAVSTIDFTGKTGQDVWGGTLTIGDTTYQFVEAAGDGGANGETEVVVGKDDDAAAIAAALVNAGTNPTNVTLADAGNGKVTATADANSAADGAAGNAATKVTIGRAGADPIVSGDYNVSTTVIAKKGDDGKDRIASTYFDLTEEMVTDGSKIRIGNEEYTFSTNEKDQGKDGIVYIGDLDTKDAGYMTEVAERLTKAAENNDVYTVGHDGKRMSFTENVSWANGDTDAFDLRTMEGVEKSFGFTSAGREADESRSLTLQIGDTSDSFNQMKVSVGDMHVSAMGTEGGAKISDIDISTQDGAAAAVQTIKDAINYVSSVRGDLGAIQNRLEHTQNNLSVMAENIQDAESTIRDTDVAEEMMSYVKNNILVQSAQAMLAQANQVPQGVLQLLG